MAHFRGVYQWSRGKNNQNFILQPILKSGHQGPNPITTTSISSIKNSFVFSQAKKMVGFFSPSEAAGCRSMRLEWALGAFPNYPTNSPFRCSLDLLKLDVLRTSTMDLTLESSAPLSTLLMEGEYSVSYLHYFLGAY